MPLSRTKPKKVAAPTVMATSGDIKRNIHTLSVIAVGSNSATEKIPSMYNTKKK